MVENWIENTGLAYFRYWYADGTFERRILVGPYCLLDGQRVGEHIHTTGFRLSFYDLITMSGPIPTTGEEELRAIKSYPLLRLLLGKHVTCEVPDEDSAYNTKIDGKWYTITRHQRWTSYTHFRRWLKIKDTWLQCYTITSEVDDDLPPYSFAHRTWVGRTPSPEEVLKQAKELQVLAQELADSLSAQGYEKQPTEEKKDAL